MSYFSMSQEQREEQRKLAEKKTRNYIIGGVAVFLVFIVLISSFGSVPRNHVGILTRAGVVQQVELDEGWKLKIPFVDRIDSMSNEVQTTRIAAGGDKPTTKDTAETKDQQIVPEFEFEIKHQLARDKSFSVFKNYGMNYEKMLIEDNALAIIKQVFSMYNSEELVDKKLDIPTEVARRLNEITSPVGVEIIIVNMKNYDFTPEYNAILEERAMLSAQLKNNEIKQNNEKIAAQTEYDVAVKKAEKEAETARIKAENDKAVALIQAEQNKETALIEAQAQADAKKIAVDNEAYVITTKAEADKAARLATAEAIKAELEAQASGLNDLIIQKQFLEKWDGKLIPNFGGSGTGITFTNMTDILKQYLPIGGGVEE